MSSREPLKATHQSFVDWAVSSQGVKINGVEAARISGRGHGIIASQDIAKGQRLVFVPAKALITIESGFVKRLKLPANCTVHGRLAAALMLLRSDDSRHYLPWENTWPPREDFAQIMPIQWEHRYSDLLPQSAKGAKTREISLRTSADCSSGSSV